MPPKPKPTHKKICVDKRGKFKKCPPQPRRPKVTAGQIAALKADKLAKQERVKRLRKDIKNLPSGSLESRLKKEQLAKLLIKLGGRGEQKSLTVASKIVSGEIPVPKGSYVSKSGKLLLIKQSTKKNLDREGTMINDAGFVVDKPGTTTTKTSGGSGSGSGNGSGSGSGSEKKGAKKVIALDKPPEGNRSDPFGYYDFPDADQFFSNYNS